jgi:hypothetical protein
MCRLRRSQFCSLFARRDWRELLKEESELLKISKIRIGILSNTVQSVSSTPACSVCIINNAYVLVFKKVLINYYNLVINYGPFQSLYFQHTLKFGMYCKRITSSRTVIFTFKYIDDVLTKSSTEGSKLIYTLCGIIIWPSTQQIPNK